MNQITEPSGVSHSIEQILLAEGQGVKNRRLALLPDTARLQAVLGLSRPELVQLFADELALEDGGES